MSEVLSDNSDMRRD
jgi:chromosome segregation ATPase